MKKIHYCATVVACVLSLCGCSPGPDLVPAPSPVSQLSVVYACSPALPVLTGSVLVYDTSRILFGTQPDGADIAAATGNVASGKNVKLSFCVGTAAQNSVLYTNTFDMVADSNYAMFFGGPASNPSTLFVQNDMTAPPSGMAKVRFVILSSDTNRFNVFLGSVKIDSGLTYQSVSPFIEVPADSLASCSFSNASNPAAAVATASFLLGSGGICIVVLSGNYGSDNFFWTTKIVSLNPGVVL